MDNSTDYLQKLNDDLISQFKRQPNTKALMSAIAKQLHDLRQAQEQLNDLRYLSNAEGRQLDGIGDIVVLSRADAARYEIGRPNANEIDDAVFRKYLYYKLFLNTSTGTRKEIMQALHFFWNEAPLYYSENPAFPATIFVDTPELAPTVPIEGLLDAPIVKPAGVRFIVRVHTKTENEQYRLRMVGLSVVKITKTQVGEIEQNVVVGQVNLRVVGLSIVKNTKTQVSEIAQGAVTKQLRTTYAPRWEISRTDTGSYSSAAESAQHYNGLATVKITKTPLAAYGGD